MVYVSFGSTVKPSQMSKEKKRVFLDTFARLDMAVRVPFPVNKSVSGVSGGLEVGRARPRRLAWAPR